MTSQTDGFTHLRGAHNPCPDAAIFFPRHRETAIGQGNNAGFKCLLAATDLPVRLEAFVCGLFYCHVATGNAIPIVFPHHCDQGPGNRNALAACGLHMMEHLCAMNRRDINGLVELPRRCHYCGREHKNR